MVRNLYGAPLAGLALAIALPASPLCAQAFPARPLMIVNGNAAGGAPDILARQMAEELRQSLGQNVLVVNRTGANGSIAVESVRRATPDGHTLLFATMTTMAVNPHLQKDARYNGAHDFEPVATQVLQPLLWATTPAQPFKSLRDVVDMARAHPGKLNAPRTGFGASPHLTLAALTSRNRIDLTLIGFTGSADAFIALRRGDVQLMVDLPQSMWPRIQNGDLVPLAITSSARVKAFPAIPTWIEQGVMDQELTTWYVYLAPKGTPAPIVNQLNAEINKVLAQPKFRHRLEEVGGIVRTLAPAEVRRFMAEEHVRWGALLKTANIQPD
ncbi:MAG: Bug family tripartite tricarboxylate transporter substrate binding protein [bacterium]|jgi:tripartite-type tricarboxylate transporter receptor subunit TctC|nr:tripartite tricarboxylate transporter substrate binding protein [Betaproteobacteria bacterium]